MKLFEAFKKPFIKPNSENEIKTPSSSTDELKIIRPLSDDDIEITSMAFSDIQTGTEFGLGASDSLIIYQNKIINTYRKLAKNPDVNHCIDIIIDEMVFTVNDREITISIDEENNTIKEKIVQVFDKIYNLLNTTENIHSICRQMYVDGQLNIVLVYDKSSTSTIRDGIKHAYITEPVNLYFNKDEKLWKYAKTELVDYLYSTNSYNIDEYDEEFTTDELIHVDYGLTAPVTVGDGVRGRVNLGYLENAFKSANQLETLENSLVPLRYNRSVSRRLFNIDVANLPPKKAKELMDKIRNEFKYKKTYDTNTGTIKNQQTTQNLVEDYWLSNRNGGRGTTVELLDERGQLMDLDDIIYATKKLYTSMKIPNSRNPYIDQDGGNFDFDTTQTTNDDLNFYLHIDRLRIPIEKMFKEILKREIIITGVMNETEWYKYEDKIKINFANKSAYLDNMKSQTLMNAIGNYNDIKDDIGSLIPISYVAKMIFGWSTEEFEEHLKTITEERNNPLYKAFYAKNDDNSNGSW